MKMKLITVLAIVSVSCETMPQTEMKAENIALEEVGNFDVAPASSSDAFRVASSKESKILLSDRKLIKNGALSFETEDIEKTKKEIDSLTILFRGYIATENRDSYSGKVTYTQTIRLPANQFESFVEALSMLGHEMREKNINAHDVTEEFIDLEARLKTKKDLEVRFRDLLKFARTVEDMLSIENQLERVRSDVESMEGRLIHLKNQVSFSTLNLSYYETTDVNFGFTSKFTAAFKTGWDNLMVLVITLIGIWPFLIFGLIISYGLLRLRKIRWFRTE